MTPVLDAALSALRSFGKKMDVTANNIANADTDGFKKSQAVLEEANPSGVTVSISKVNTPGAMILSEEALRETSNVSLDEELINLKTTKHAYNANLKMMKAEDERLGTLLDSIG